VLSPQQKRAEIYNFENAGLRHGEAEALVVIEDFLGEILSTLKSIERGIVAIAKSRQPYG
jgi:hypothetical protein